MGKYLRHNRGERGGWRSGDLRRSAALSSLDDVAAHEEAVRRLPDAVKEAWTLYLADENRTLYPHGFAYHFPVQWRWMELQNPGCREQPPADWEEPAPLDPDNKWPSGRVVGTNSPSRRAWARRKLGGG